MATRAPRFPTVRRDLGDPAQPQGPQTTLLQAPCRLEAGHLPPARLRALDEIEESRSVPERKVLCQFSAQGRARADPARPP